MQANLPASAGPAQGTPSKQNPWTGQCAGHACEEASPELVACMRQVVDLKIQVREAQETFLKVKFFDLMEKYFCS